MPVALRTLSRITAIFVFAWLTGFRVAISAQTNTIQPSAPSVVAPPAWSRVMPMPDGRTFVTDGGLTIDAAVARPATLPSVRLPPESGKLMARYFAGPFTTDVGLRDLRTGDFKNTFKTADGISLNGNYVNFLRAVLPSGARLRLKSDREPIVVMVGDKPIAVLMPVASPAPR